MICARLTLSSMSAIVASTWPCRSFAAWYSAFSDRSPWARASSIASTISGRSCRRLYQLGGQHFIAFRQHRDFFHSTTP